MAAMAMLAAQLVWRVGWPETGVQAFPELVVAAVARLTPLGLFGFATETFGSLAQNTLFVVVLIGTIAAGAEAGGWAARLADGGRLGVGFAGRLAAGVIVTAALLLLSLVTVLPVANLGFFAAESSRQGAVLVQLATTFALWALVWALLDASFAWAQAAPAPGRPVTLNRRTAVGRFALGAGTLALAGTIGSTAWRLMR
ncbi:MAG: hypothetical protein M3Q10_00300, partial [Chloroflexota bacterium]|nr:hypothetical protein [Chloroflexota bacterium]